MMNRKSKNERRKPPIRIVVGGCEAGLARMLRGAARRTLEFEKHTGSVEIQVLGAAAMARQHCQWLGKNVATDVLTFDLRDTPRKGRVEGQLLICREVARKIASKQGHDWKKELALYVIHGCLHLCGYDDQSPSQFRRIHDRERRIFADLGWTAISP